MTHPSTKIHAFIIKNNRIYQIVLFYDILKEYEKEADKPRLSVTADKETTFDFDLNKK